MPTQSSDLLDAIEAPEQDERSAFFSSETLADTPSPLDTPEALSSHGARELAAQKLFDLGREVERDLHRSAAESAPDRELAAQKLARWLAASSSSRDDHGPPQRAGRRAIWSDFRQKHSRVQAAALRLFCERTPASAVFAAEQLRRSLDEIELRRRINEPVPTQLDEAASWLRLSLARELAPLFEVSDPTIRKWLAGETPSRSSRDRLRLMTTLIYRAQKLGWDQQKLWAWVAERDWRLLDVDFWRLHAPRASTELARLRESGSPSPDPHRRRL